MLSTSEQAESTRYRLRCELQQKSPRTCGDKMLSWSRRYVRRGAKRTWIGACVTCTIFSVWLASYIWGITYHKVRLDHSQFSIQLASGCIELVDYPYAPALTKQTQSSNFYITDSPPRFNGLSLRPWRKRCTKYAGLRCVIIPILPYFLLSAVATAVLALLNRPFAPHCCRNCGYSLIGNISRICPECGTPIPEEQKQAIGVPHV